MCDDEILVVFVLCGIFSSFFFDFFQCRSHFIYWHCLLLLLIIFTLFLKDCVVVSSSSHLPAPVVDVSVVSEMMTVVLRWVMVLGVEGHRIGWRPMHHGCRSRCTAVHHVTHAATVGTVSSTRTGWIQSHCKKSYKYNQIR